MIHSMTGFGRAAEAPYTIEIRAVNHRYLDLSFRLPRNCAFLEEGLKAQLGAALGRGKVELALIVDQGAAEAPRPELNRAALEAYLDTAEILQEDYNLTGELSIRSLLSLPDVMQSRRAEPDEKRMGEAVHALCAKALEDFVGARRREGARLSRDILAKLDAVESLTGQVAARYPAAVEAYRTRLRAKMEELLGDRTVSEERLLTEAALYADRMCADEETVRLQSHCVALRALLEGGEAAGRKLDFWVQELAREANTIGSKSQDKDSSKLVIDLKAEIEKIREQVQNIE